MTTKQIFEAFLIPQNLQEHMLRVASLARIITYHWTGPDLDKMAIVEACLFHDIAKPLTFDLAKQAQFGMSQAEIDSLDRLQMRLKSNYGDNEHRATVEICRELGCSSAAIKIVSNLDWSLVDSLISKNDIESLVPIYADMRIGPKGILPLNDRLEDLNARTGRSDHWASAIQLEKMIGNNVSIDLNSISDEQIYQHFNYLENLIHNN